MSEPRPTNPPEVIDDGLLDSAYTSLSRRRFLQAAGFTFVGAMVYGCARAPEEELLPLLEQPEGMVPGRADYYATTCGGCAAGCGILAKSRDGRPIKLEGNPEHPISKGGLCAVGQASLLGLYDSHRYRAPVRDGEESDWARVDAEIREHLDRFARSGAKVRYLSAVVNSPTKQRAIDDFLSRFRDARHVMYDPARGTAILDAYEETHGARVVPHIHLDRARIIVGFDADFLGTWISPVEFTRDYTAARRADRDGTTFSRHLQFESTLSITGAKADQRYRVAPSSRVAVLSQLAAAVARKAGRPYRRSENATDSLPQGLIEEVADELWVHRGESVVLCGADDLTAQLICNFINDALGNYGRTLDLDRPSFQVQGSEAQLEEVLGEIAAGKVDLLIVDGVNPLLDLPGKGAGAAELAKIRLIISFAQRPDESSALAHYICPDHHYLESWSDTEMVQGVVGFTQPLIRPLGDTRQVVETLAAWSGKERSARAQLQERWGTGRQWEQRLHNGFVKKSAASFRVGGFRTAPVFAARAEKFSRGDGFELVLYTKAGMPNAGHAFNPWLHELPDPITKAVWDNYARLSPAAAERIGLSQGDVVSISLPTGESVELPVLVQAGQHDNVVAVAMGYGAEASRRFESMGPSWIEKKPTVGDNGLVGVSATPLVVRGSSGRRFSGTQVRLHATGRKSELALTQDYQSIDVPAHLAPASGARRPNIQESTVAALAVSESSHSAPHHKGDLWPEDHEYTGHHWGMTIDLTACTGCGGCVVACQVENNVPVVGKDEVRRNREMHWIRIDRYFSGSGDDLTVAHQPMMCHQCDNAPCETVCPVLATVHSEEGLNEQIYNRCVGTRYCMNNCPYKVRRFNWFEYSRDDAYENLTLNPDVTVRSRGVMEKCSFCAQRIHEAKAEARRGGRPLADGDIRTACQQSCPAQAIVFGDMNDAQSEVAASISSRRHYRVLEEINVKPSVGYLQLVRNREDGEGRDHHDG